MSCLLNMGGNQRCILQKAVAGGRPAAAPEEIGGLVRRAGASARAGAAARAHIVRRRRWAARRCQGGRAAARRRRRRRPRRRGAAGAGAPPAKVRRKHGPSARHAARVPPATMWRNNCRAPRKHAARAEQWRRGGKARSMRGRARGRAMYPREKGQVDARMHVAARAVNTHVHGELRGDE